MNDAVSKTPRTAALKFIAINTGSPDDQWVVDAGEFAQLERRLAKKEQELAEANQHKRDLQEHLHAAEAARPPFAAQDALADWSREVRVTIRGIDGQAQRLLGPPSMNWRAGDEEIIVGYKLNTGLWHRLLGLLASCPMSETPPSPRDALAKGETLRIAFTCKDLPHEIGKLARELLRLAGEKP